ncbi:MAG: aldo/keto reductase [Synergistaceae bacterium]|jgi:predicted aldo/keto reductase-like oxidoreductase|nr:aldo/keto reductase [Synergistaceae bacterium]
MEMRSFDRIGKKISLLGFGLMRLPLRSASAKDIDRETGRRMIDKAIGAGVNYFDTAWVYHEGESEVFAGEALSEYPRESYSLATKMPVWLLESGEDLGRIFDEQLRKCRVDYFDFYLLHNIGGPTYDMAIKYKAYEFLRKKKEEGRIRNLGFSLHDSPELLEKIVNGWEWDFAQIQLNYIDWEVIDAKRQYEILASRGIPVVIMEPVRGGALANLNPEAEGILKSADPSASPASWAIRYAASLPGVLTVLSGMSNMEQVEDNLNTMADFRPLSEGERSVLSRAAASYLSSGTIPCTGCRYCMDCPAGVDIPRVFAIYNHYRMALSNNQNMAPIVFRNTYRTLADSQKAHNCVSCGKCVSHCPQGIDVPNFMKGIAELAAA